MSNSIVVLLPIFFVLALGYFAGRAKQFSRDQASGLNELVVDYALPAALFVGTSTASRAQLLQQGAFFLAILAAFVGLYFIAWLISRSLFHHTVGAAALQAWMCSAPTAAFLGTPILTGIFGASSALAVSLSNIVMNVIQVPATVTLIELERSQQAKEHTNLSKMIQSSLLTSVKSPLVFVPLLAFLLVLIGVQVPSIVNQILSLIGTASSGVAIFASGLTMAAYKLKLNQEVITNSLIKIVVQPLVVAVLVLWLGVPHPNAQEAILIGVLPTSSVGVVLASRYHLYEAESASTLLLTSVMVIVSLPIAIALTSH